jgi:hypothetical protein
MSILKTVASTVGGVALLFLLIVAVVAIGSIIGGILGAAIALGYNVAFGASVEVLKFALIGSIVAVIGGSASAGGSNA